MEVTTGRNVTRGLREGTAKIVSSRPPHNGGSLEDNPREIASLLTQPSSEEEEYRAGELASLCGKVERVALYVRGIVLRSSELSA